MRLRTAVPIAAAGALSACATAQLHSEAELDSVALACGLSYGDLVQEEELRKVLIVFRVAPSANQRVCAYQWARKNHMRLTVIDAVTAQ